MKQWVKLGGWSTTVESDKMNGAPFLNAVRLVLLDNCREANVDPIYVVEKRLYVSQSDENNESDLWSYHYWALMTEDQHVVLKLSGGLNITFGEVNHTYWNDTRLSKPWMFCGRVHIGPPMGRNWE